MGGHGDVQREFVRTVYFVQQKTDQHAVSAILLVLQRQGHGLLKQMAHQGVHLDDLALLLSDRRLVGLDVQTMSPYAEKKHLMGHLRRYPHSALWRHHPCAKVRGYLHDAFRSIEQLSASMAVHR